jgi:hypothetical protein
MFLDVWAKKNLATLLANRRSNVFITSLLAVVVSESELVKRSQVRTGRRGVHLKSSQSSLSTPS